jgi:hypothetical protein
MPKTKKRVKKPTRDIVVSLDCYCGRRHIVRFARGELETMLQSIKTGETITFQVRHTIAAPKRAPDVLDVESPSKN